MNLNFFPDTYNNGYTNNQYNNNNIVPNQSTQTDLNDYINRLQGQLSNLNRQQQNTQQVGQPYVLYCGNKKDWDEFLILNYGITEQNIFDDYKLFLQAKKEIIDEQGQNKINNMKDKIKQGVVQPDATIKSNIKPKPFNRRYNRDINNRDNNKPNNRTSEQNENNNNK